MRTREAKLYNVIFPMFLIALHPYLMLPFAVANFIIDSAVILICFKLLHCDGIKLLYKKTCLKVWLLGFSADFIGAGLLWIISSLAYNIGGDLTFSLQYNPYRNPYALVITIATVLLCGALIYVFNRWISFRKVDLTLTQKRIISLAMAVVTAPYLFLIPAYY